MSTTWKLGAMAALLAATGAWRAGETTPAQENPAVAKTGRGGLLVKTKQHQFEVFFFPTGVRVFPFTADGAPQDASQLTGTATFYHPNSPQPWFSRPLKPAAGTPSPSIDLVIGLTNAPATGATVTFEVDGLADSSGSKVAFTVPLEFIRTQAVQPAQANTDVSSVPRYVYMPGYYGYGYYQYSAPGTTVARQPGRAAYYAARRRGSDQDYVGPQHRDWASGRDSPLAKPWLKPMD